MSLSTSVALATIVLAGPMAGDDPIVTALIAAHNRERAERKLPPLVGEAKLARAAQAHAADMAAHKAMTHDGSDGSTPVDRVKRVKYTYMNTGENVAYGQDSVAGVMTAWMNSPHHRENILGDFSEIGVAVAESEDGTPYWCVDFGRPFPKLVPADAEREVADRLNHARSDAGKGVLRVDPKLAAAARKIAGDLAAQGTLGGDRADADRDKDGRAATVDRIKESGYRYAALTQGGSVGPPTPEALIKQQLDTPEQKAALIGDFSDLGVGYALSGEGRPFWCLLMARPLR